MSCSASGQVVGASATASGAGHAFSWTRAGGMIDLHRDAVDGRFSSAQAVNARGQVIGSSYPPGGFGVGVLRQNSVRREVVDLPALIRRRSWFDDHPPAPATSPA